MATNKVIKDFKVLYLPATGEPNSRYTVLDGINAKLYVTDEAGAFYLISSIDGGAVGNVDGGGANAVYTNGLVIDGGTA